MIEIKKSSCADTRTCDWSKVTEEQLLQQSLQHIEDVKMGFDYLIFLLKGAKELHDRTKISHIKEFHENFKTGFKKTDWWQMHQKEERHHFNNPEFVQDDINLIDVIEQIIDGVMAGMARSGQFRYEPLSSELLQKAYENTTKLLLKEVIVVKN